MPTAFSRAERVSSTLHANRSRSTGHFDGLTYGARSIRATSHLPFDRRGRVCLAHRYSSVIKVPHAQRNQDATLGVSPDASGGVAMKPQNLTGRRCGSYELIDKIGDGGMGEVWRARSQALGESWAAVKVLHRDVNDRPESLARFLQEIAIMGAIASRTGQNVLRAFDTGVLEGDGRQYVVLEYCPDGSLEDLLVANGVLSFSLAYTILEQMAEALATAHSNNIIHRDFKPANVLLIRQGERYIAKLSDFGVAKLLGEKLDDAILRTQSMKVLGSCDYMPVEQAHPKRGVAPDHRIDIYAFGAVLYRCVTGRTPYVSKTVIDAIVNVAKRTPFPAPSAIRGDVPPALDAVIMKCLAWDRESRFQSMNAVAAELTDAIQETQLPRSRFAPHRKSMMLETNLKVDSASALTISEVGRTVVESCDSMAAPTISDDVGAAVARALQSAVGLSTERRVTQVLVDPAGTRGANPDQGTHAQTVSRMHVRLGALVGVVGIVLGVGTVGVWRLYDEHRLSSATNTAASSPLAGNDELPHPSSRARPVTGVHRSEGVIVVRIGPDSVWIDGGVTDETTPLHAKVPGGVHKVVLMREGERSSLSLNLTVTGEDE